MPNIKSAEKRVHTSEKNRMINKSVKSEISTYIKNFKNALSNNEIEKAEELYKKVEGFLDSATRRNIIHINNATRKKAHFAKLLDTAKKS